jgi:hypothetical protein
VKLYETEKYRVQRFIPHAEQTLLRYLIANGYHPSVLGISKVCCASCAAFVKGVNGASHPTAAKWIVGGSHGRVYNVVLGDEHPSPIYAGVSAVREWIYNAIVELVESVRDQCRPSATQSPGQESDSEMDEAPTASLYRPRRVCPF